LEQAGCGGARPALAFPPHVRPSKAAPHGQCQIASRKACRYRYSPGGSKKVERCTSAGSRASPLGTGPRAEAGHSSGGVRWQADARALSGHPRRQGLPRRLAARGQAAAVEPPQRQVHAQADAFRGSARRQESGVVQTGAEACVAISGPSKSAFLEVAGHAREADALAAKHLRGQHPGLPASVKNRQLGRGGAQSNARRPVGRAASGPHVHPAVWRAGPAHPASGVGECGGSLYCTHSHVLSSQQGRLHAHHPPTSAP